MDDSLFDLYRFNPVYDKIEAFTGGNIGEIEVNITSIKEPEERRFFIDMFQDKLDQLNINYNIKNKILPF